MRRKSRSERRTQYLRRDLNDLVRSEDGKVSEAKCWANVGKFIAMYLLLMYSQSIIERWDSLAILLTILVAPDMFKGLLRLRYGAAGEKK